MKALVLAAGLGTRLRPLTNEVPKALVPLNGIPMLEIALRRLEFFGFDEIFINVHHKGSQIIDFVKRRTNNKAQLIISDEREELLDTGGAIKKVFIERQLKDPLLIYNADIISDLDLKSFYLKHIKEQSDISLSLKKRSSTRSLLFSANGILKGWRHNSTLEMRWRSEDKTFEWDAAFNGIHILNPICLNHFPKKDVFPIMDFYLNEKEPCIKGFIHQESSFIDAGKLETLPLAEELAQQLVY